jgi:hypothetical protein
MLKFRVFLEQFNTVKQPVLLSPPLAHSSATCLAVRESLSRTATPTHTRRPNALLSTPTTPNNYQQEILLGCSC